MLRYYCKHENASKYLLWNPLYSLRFVCYCRWLKTLQYGRPNLHWHYVLLSDIVLTVVYYIEDLT